MPLFYVETGRGCCIETARDANQAGKKVLREVGTHEGVRAVRLATEKDLAWVAGMGGAIPVDLHTKQNKVRA